MTITHASRLNCPMQRLAEVNWNEFESAAGYAKELPGSNVLIERTDGELKSYSIVFADRATEIVRKYGGRVVWTSSVVGVS